MPTLVITMANGSVQRHKGWTLEMAERLKASWAQITPPPVFTIAWEDIGDDDGGYKSGKARRPQSR